MIFHVFFVSLFLTFGPKWGPNSINRTVTFFNVFRYFSQRSFWGGSGIDFGWIFDDFGRVLVWFWELLGWISDDFWEDFGGNILGRFWECFGNMLIHFGRICDDFACLWNFRMSVALLVSRGAFLTFAGVACHLWRCSALFVFYLALFGVACLCWRCLSLLYASVR